MGGNLVSFPVQFLYGGVVGVLVGDEESTLGGATVGVVTAILEDSFVHDDVVVVDGVVESDGDHLRHRVRFQFAGNLGAVG